ncbi:heat shock protein 90C [Ostreococcus tauri]|uniref:Heat shock protein 90C n=1 Tax=Ostreococcus tauri TaxID=70448 RepID=A0A1Y5I2I4_OSTTA|nr:heat shock protein 90C [Ostreococcus tauri]
MDLIVNSLYSNKDVFLRELVSNASDACDKLRFVSLSDSSAMQAGEELRIKIRGDPESKTLTIEDSGIGMSRDDLVSSLGTIARSGTAKFMEMLKSQSDGENLIGKFGVGFYSAFLVADKITVFTKAATGDDKTWMWESEINSSSYTVKEADEAMSRGTKIVLHLKEGCEEFASGDKLQSLVKTYSEFISFPIDVWAQKNKEKEVVDQQSTDALKEAWTKKKIEAEAKGEEFTEPEPQPVTKKEFEQVEEWTTANNDKPIWVRSPKDVDQESYNEFFKATFKEFLDPLAHSHFAVEGDIEFRSILFVPGMAPFEQQDMMSKSKAIKLFVRRVFISDEFDDSLLPRYLTFVRGVVDSSDLPLNVSREILQESRVVRVIRKRLIRKTFDMLRDIAERDNDDYDTFWDNFGRNLKLGVIEDADNRKDLAELLRFTTSKSSGDGDLRSLDQYVNDMPEAQKSIYFVAADNRDAAEASPFLEKLKQKGFEVLYLLDPIDEVAMANLATFKEKPIVDASKEALDMGDEDEKDKAALEELEKEFKDLTEWMKETLGTQVEKVTVSNRLTDTPCVLVTSKFGWSANMERIMKAQAMGDNRASDYMKGKKTMEINPSSPVIAQLRKLKEAGSKEAADSCQLLFDTALLTSGFSIDKPSVFASRVFKLMTAQAAAAENSSDDGCITPEIV